MRNPMPFPQANQGKALNDEDTFMREHGGSGSRATFLIVNTIASIYESLVKADQIRKVGAFQPSRQRRNNF